MKKQVIIATVSAALFSMSGAAMAETKVYADFPVTLKGYSGDKKNSVSYSGQMARHVLHNSLKSLLGKTDGSGDASKMMQYFDTKDEGRAVLSPKSNEQFPNIQQTVDDLSKGKNLSGKSYKGQVNGWGNGLTGKEILAQMITLAAKTNKGYDAENGLDYKQLISKTAMGAIFYNQAVDNYLDEKLSAEKKPNDKPYKDGKHYTGKEHSWDEGFGYFGAPAHALSLDAKTLYGIAKGKEDALKAADANGDGKIDLMTEMVYAHAYYAAGADKSGKTTYMKDIMNGFIEGRQLIADAKGEKLTDAQRADLMKIADGIKMNWEKVIAEATYKYAGSVYGDLEKLQGLKEKGEDTADAMRKYAKHWGELKGFALALQMGGKDLGEIATKLNRLVGMGPVLMNGEQVTATSDKGVERSKTISMGEYMMHMIKVQKILDKKFGLKAKAKEITDEVAKMSEFLGEKASAEND